MPFPRGGILAALWLPTDANGALRREDLGANLEFLRSRGIHGVLALGSTGEFPQFDLEQRKHALATVAEMAAPLPVIANVSDIRPPAVAELGALARDLGLPAIAVMPPGFYPSSQPDLLAHFLHAAEASGLPTILYNFPELTGTRIDLETIAAFAGRAPLAGVKQSGREFEYHRELVRLGREKGFVVFSGADTRLPEVFALGAAGCIGGLVNFVPELMLRLYRVCRSGEVGSIHPDFEQLREIGRIIDRLTFPLNVAAGMEARGLATGAPKAVVSEHSREVYRGIVAELRQKFLEWGIAKASATASPLANSGPPPPAAPAPDRSDHGTAKA
ncbi:MAG TPA: dihydrodipicolinate synthase family protein [Opitutaceae bacterium]|nr:dihydrodipicolinate synthase family protein [Opitutaceae bacterium]